MKFTAEQIEEIRYGIGGTREGAEQVIQEVAQMIAAKIEGMYTDEDLTDCEPTAVALASLVEQLKATNGPHEGPARASCAGHLDAVVGPQHKETKA